MERTRTEKQYITVKLLMNISEICFVQLPRSARNRTTSTTGDRRQFIFLWHLHVHSKRGTFHL